MTWSVRQSDPQAAEELGRRIQVAPAVAQVLLHRGIEQSERAQAFLNPRLADLCSPSAMVDRQRSAERIVKAIRSSERVAVFGDYDVDGATSAAIIADIIETLGGTVETFVADRFRGGYGLSQAAWEQIEPWRPDLLITCDCGSADHERIEQANSSGADVIVVDHHLVPEKPLPAFAFLNPHRPDCGFEFKGMCSAGLAFSLSAAIRKELGAALDLRPWLDLVALGTIADVAPLTGDNRILVRAGLSRLGEPRVRPGLHALREVAAIRPGPLAAHDVAFRFAPRLNAAGRLGESDLAIRLLRAKTEQEARGLAARLEALNDERKRLQQEVSAAAIEQVRELYGDTPNGVVVAAGQRWHRGVLGIVAARLADTFRVPAIAIGLEEGMGVGSGRTRGDLDLHAIVSSVSSHLEGFGGHRAALGVRVSESSIDGLRDALRQADVQFEQPGLTCDIEVGTGAFSLPRASDLFALEPLGEANPEPMVSVRVDEVIQAKQVGKQADHLKLELRVAGTRLSAFGFGMGDQLPLTKRNPTRARGMLRPDQYRGGQAIELRLLELSDFSDA